MAPASVVGRGQPMNYPDCVPLTRRSALALLAVSGLTGCSFSPIVWESTEANPDGGESGAAGKEVRPDYFAQSPDSDARTLDEGAMSSQWVSTPHFDARLDRTFVGAELGAKTSRQVREPSPIRAPEGHELVAFTMEAGSPVFGDAGKDGGEHVAQVAIEVNEAIKLPLTAPFGVFSPAEGYARPWALIILCVRTGESVKLAVRDEGKTVRVDLRTGAPEVDADWAATRGFRERVTIGVSETSAVLRRDIQTDKVNEQVQRSNFRLGLKPDAGGGLVPWLTTEGWAPEGSQWLYVKMNALVTFTPATPAIIMSLDVPRSFVYQAGTSAPIEALPIEGGITTEQIQRESKTLDVTWSIPDGDDQARITCNPVGRMVARYTDHPDVAAQFIGAPQQVMFRLKFTPMER